MKCPYLKPGSTKHSENLVRYIANRDGVQKIDDTWKAQAVTAEQKKLIGEIIRGFPDAKDSFEYEDYLSKPSKGSASEFISHAIEDNIGIIGKRENYVGYIARRPRAERHGSHGLFTDADIPIDLSQVAKEVAEHTGNVWTNIISLRREDAARLGYDNVYVWRNLLRSQAMTFAKNMKIPLSDLRWYAAYHDESYHPHVHMVVYSVGKEPYLSKDGIAAIKSSLARQIFKHDLLQVYVEQTNQRNELTQKNRDVLSDIVSRINSGSYDNPVITDLLLKLTEQLKHYKGKKVYGYLPQAGRNIVNAIVDELAKDQNIAALYDLWYEQRDAVTGIYQDTPEQRIPLSQNKEFKAIKNAVIQEAMNILHDRVTFEEVPESSLSDADESESSRDADWDEIEPTEWDRFYGSSGNKNKKSWWTDEYKKARQFFYGTKETPPDFDSAFSLMQIEAKKGNGFAMHDLAKMYLSGLGCEKDEEQAQAWFSKAYHAFTAQEAKVKKKDYFQYRIGKLFSFGYGVEQDYGKAAEWYEKAVSEDNPFAVYALGSLYRRGQGVEQNDEKAYELYCVAAEHTEKPNAYAAYELGRMCRDGIGTASDKAASEAWCRRAYQGFLMIEQNMADDKLYYRLGQMNMGGIGTAVNLPKAKRYFEKAAKLDNPDALYGLGKLFLRKDSEYYEPNKAVDCLLQAAQKGHEFSAYALGKLFLKGDEVPKNVGCALQWLEEAVVKENQYAEYLLGKTLLMGVDTEQDMERGVQLLTASAGQKNCCAQYTLGKAYLEGVLLPQNIPESIRLLTESADGGFTPAQYLLGKLLYRGEIVMRDIGRALLYLEQASEKENAYAAYLAGKIRLTEEGFKDVPKAVRLFQIAAAQQNSFAEFQLGLLYLRGKDVARDEREAIRWLALSAEHGNSYAARLLHSIKSGQNWSAALGALRLLQHLSRMIQNRLEDERKGTAGMTERKLKRKIDEKKQAHGLRQG